MKKASGISNYHLVNVKVLSKWRDNTQHRSPLRGSIHSGALTALLAKMWPETCMAGIGLGAEQIQA